MPPSFPPGESTDHPMSGSRVGKGRAKKKEREIWAHFSRDRKSKIGDTIRGRRNFGECPLIVFADYSTDSHNLAKVKGDPVEQLHRQ
ncbi:hypothetical protein CDAR_527351 [Caerostris darwini]|uniref:Transposase n=1 Tax=Caerostris darwini TaxID=1538125 RepID=A0AAV4WKV7_9ARAC|nr:hypothetical protein CDAR_527351 [Caerostris darwini]